MEKHTKKKGGFVKKAMKNITQKYKSDKEKFNMNKEAKKLLINGFILDVIDKITDDEIKTFVKKTMSLN